jgi:undecaprenyl-diphosphatase
VRTPTPRALTGRFDRWAEQPFERWRGRPTADRVFYAASEAANFSLLWHGLAWLPVVLSPTPQRVLRATGTSAALVAESAIVNGPVKAVFRRDRPVLDTGVQRPYRLRTPRTTSFPSGHASAAVVAVMVLGRRRSLPVRLALGVLGAVVASSRVHVRIHHASDVAGGLVIGYGLGRLLRRLLP